MPRSALIAILGGVLIVAAFAFTRAGATQGESTPADAAQEPAPAAEPPAKPAPKPDSARKAVSDGLPADVARALRAKRIVVLVLTQKGAEDSAVLEAANSLRGRRGVSVFTDDVRDIGEYRRVVGELNVDRAPAIVIVRRDRRAEVVEGYVDPGSLAQQVEDAR